MRETSISYPKKINNKKSLEKKQLAMSLTIKAFLHDQRWRDEPKEIRRFSVDQDVSTSYAYLLEKLAQVFPSVQAGSVIVAWMDGDGDLIVISSDEELVEALDQFDGTVFRLYLKRRSPGDFQQGSFSVPPPPPPCGRETTVETEGDSQQPTTEGESTSQQQQPEQQQKEGVLHPGVVCDGCSGPIQGTRFKCLVCNDYDLCSGCEAQGKHVDHNMVSITDPASYSPWGFQNPWAHGFGGGHPCRGWWAQRGHHGFGHRGGHHGFGHPQGYGPGCPFGGSPWGFGGGHPHCPRGAFRGRRCGGGGAPWWRSAAGKEAGQTSGTAEPMETGADAQQQSQQQQPPSEEERRSFLHGVGQAVSSFLEPFGVKVDVDVVGDDEKTPSTPPPSSGEAGPPPPSSGEAGSPPPSSGEAGPTSAAAEPETFEEVPAEFIEQALTQLRSMGYEDEGGWLTELVKAKGGDISKVLDALHPTIAETD